MAKPQELIPVNEERAVITPPAPPADETAQILQMIERAAANPLVDVEKMARLLQMKREELDKRAERDFNEAMRATQEELPDIVKDAPNQQTNSKYARLETINSVLTPVATRHGFTISFDTADSPKENHYRITARVSHTGGHSRPYQADIPIDAAGLRGTQNKTATHAFGSTLSYGRRYLLMLIFNLVTKGEDDDGQAAGRAHPPVPEFVTPAQVAELRALLQKADADEQGFCQVMRVRDLASMPARRFQEGRHEIIEFAKSHGVKL